MTVQRYDDVLVHEPGIEPWYGNVRAIKPPRPMSNKGKALEQWADVLREDGLIWIVPISYLEVVHREGSMYADDVIEDEGRTGEPPEGPFSGQFPVAS